MAMQRFMLGLTFGAFAALLWVVEVARRRAESDRARASLWPRPDGSMPSRPARSFGEVWDHPPEVA
jgi:hypothetical protein